MGGSHGKKIMEMQNAVYVKRAKKKGALSERPF
jgi:hypothetical protein